LILEKGRGGQRERDREGAKNVLFGLGFSGCVWILRFHHHPISSIYLFRYFLDAFLLIYVRTFRNNKNLLFLGIREKGTSRFGAERER
jgi:hypothetical protein